MSRISISISFSFLLLMLSCSVSQKDPLKLISQQTITEVPSASGVHYMKGTIWLVGDDAIDIFKHSVASNPDNLDSYLYLSFAYREHLPIENAVQTLQYVAELPTGKSQA